MAEINVTRVVPPPPPPPPPFTYTIDGLDEETVIALRTLLYRIDGDDRPKFPGLEKLHEKLQHAVGHLPAVLNLDGDIHVTRRNN